MVGVDDRPNDPFTLTVRRINLLGRDVTSHTVSEENEMRHNSRVMVAPFIGALLTMLSACGATTAGEPSGALARSAPLSLMVVETSIPVETSVSSSVVGSSSAPEVVEAFERLMSGRIECGRRPHQCVIDDLAVPGSPVHESLTDVMADRVRYGIVASGRGSHRFWVEDVMTVAADEVKIRVCHSDDVVLTMAVGPGRPGAIYDEAWSSHRSTWTLKAVDGVWRWTEELVERRVYEEELCDL